ncbi:unnamed protein product [Sphagnum troendelagicum]|uniref:Uncharacterized protein n=1 Tax=Sphagnum troendelagicum TaxID=128251 RepID=A0ABP0UI95_9BRYO
MKGALPLQSLWELYFKGHDCKMYSIHVHVHPNYYFPNVSLDSSVFFCHNIPSKVNIKFLKLSVFSFKLTNTSPNHNIALSIALTMLVEVDKENIVDFDTSRNLSHP